MIRLYKIHLELLGCCAMLHLRNVAVVGNSGVWGSENCAKFVPSGNLWLL